MMVYWEILNNLLYQYPLLGIFGAILPFIPDILEGLGGIFNKNKAKQEGTSTSQRQDTSESQQVTSTELGPEASGLLKTLLPILQGLSSRGNVIDPASADRTAQARAFDANRRASGLQEMLQGRANASGQGFSASSALARGTAENFRGGLLNQIFGDQARDERDIAAQNEEFNLGRAQLGLQGGVGLSALAPRTVTTNRTGNFGSNVTGTSQGTGTQSQGLLGNILGSAGVGIGEILRRRKQRNQRGNVNPEFNTSIPSTDLRLGKIPGITNNQLRGTA
jgi:hypothetical protein